MQARACTGDHFHPKAPWIFIAYSYPNFCIPERLLLEAFKGIPPSSNKLLASIFTYRIVNRAIDFDGVILDNSRILRYANQRQGIGRYTL